MKNLMVKIKYCPVCKGILIRKNKNLLECKDCEYRFYINPKPCVSIILENEKGEILLTKRKYAPHKNTWDTPGGFVDIEETSDEAMKREVKEEVGLSVKDLKYFGSYIDRYLYQGINYHLFCNAYTAKVESGILKADDDVSDIAFFPKDKIPFKEIGFQSVRTTLEDFIKK